MDKHLKKQIKRYIAWGCMVLLVFLLSVMPLLAEQQAEADGPQASILTAQAQARDITTRIIGGGQLAGAASEDITIPQEVLLTKYLVSNGDTVKKGDPIARVDTVSVMLAMIEVQETLDYLSKQMAAINSDTDPDTVEALAGGTVKIIYGKAGESVRDVMLRDGSLAVLSLTGRMAVDLEVESGLSHMDSVQVVLSDGTEVEGRVETAVGGTLTVSIEDDSYGIGDTVTVTKKDGTFLGSGDLYIHSPWNAAAYYGTITEVSVKVNDEVSAGRRLFRLKTSGHSSDYQILKQQREEYEELMQELSVMYQSGVLTAPCDGLVTGVDKDAAFLLAAPAGDGWFVQWLDNPATEITGWQIMLLNGDIPESSSTEESSEAPTESSDTQPTDPSSSSEATDPTATTAPIPDQPGGSYKVRICWVQSVAKGNYSCATTLNTQSVSSLNDVNTALVGLDSTSSFAAASYPVYTLDSATGGPGGSYGASVKAGDILMHVTDSTGTYFVYVGNKPVPKAPTIQKPQSGMMNGMGGFGGMGGGYAQSVFELYTLEELTIATVTSQEKMSLEITIDEQDISRLHIGQEATVTVEPLTGQSFPAVITAIGNTGTNAGGSSKFTAKLTLGMRGDMLPGMNASAFLDLDTAASVLTVPVAALTEKGAKTVLYTSYSEEEESFGGEVTVTTGLSDGEYVQILSGLEEGTTVYYAYYDTLEISNVPDRGFGF